MSRYAVLPDFIRAGLNRIAPSGEDKLRYYPCRVTLKSGESIDRVYVAPEEPYFYYWGVYPEDDPAKRWIRIEDVVEVQDSPTRLPARFANEIYRQGESGMGYSIFAVVFSDGNRQACVTGGAVDFIHYPLGKGPSDVVEVLPHEGRDAQPVKGPEYYWCLYSEQAD